MKKEARIDTQITQGAVKIAATPCIGICSTTYGDLVCRGCGRFSHEVVAWNSYDDHQKQQIWQRLSQLRDQASRVYLHSFDRELLEDAAQRLFVRCAPQETPAGLAILVLKSGGQLIGAQRTEKAHGLDDRDLFVAIDREFSERMQAHYEHAFRRPLV